MKTLNTTINRSKNEKNDEFYTQCADIEKEVRHYRDQFRGMTVLCNCAEEQWAYVGYEVFLHPFAATS